MQRLKVRNKVRPEIKMKKYFLVLILNGPNDNISAEEVLEFSLHKNDFANAGCDVVGISTNRNGKNKDWVKNISTEAGLEDRIELYSPDDIKSVIKDFDGFNLEQICDSNSNFNAFFIIDTEGKIRCHNVLSPDVAFSKEECLRLVNAFKSTDSGKTLAPADWTDQSDSVAIDSDSIQKFYASRTAGVIYTGEELDGGEKSDSVEKKKVHLGDVEEKEQEYRRSDNPLRIWKPEIGIFDWIKLAFFAVTLLPIRFIGYWLTLLFAVLIVNIGVIGLDEDKPISSYYHRFLRTLFYINIRLHLACFGIFTIKQTGRKAAPCDVRVIIAAPHASYLDGFVLYGAYRNMPMVIVKEDVAKMPLIGKAVRFMQCLAVNRSDESSKETIKVELTKRVLSEEEWPQLLVFPEGTLTNGRSMMRFKPGGFLPGVPVEPVIVKYINKLDTTTSINFDPDGYYKSSLLTMCQLFTNVQLEILPPYIPGKEEIDDPQLFCDNVKELMAKTMGIPVCPKPYRWLKSGGEFLELFDKATAKFKKFGNDVTDEIKNAGSDLDLRKLGLDVQESFKKFDNEVKEDYKKFRNDVADIVNNAGSEIDLEKLGHEIQESFDKFGNDLADIVNNSSSDFEKLCHNAQESFRKFGNDVADIVNNVGSDFGLEKLSHDMQESFKKFRTDVADIVNDIQESFETLPSKMKAAFDDKTPVRDNSSKDI